MKRNIQLALALLAITYSQTNYGFVSVSSAEANVKCTQNLDQKQTINCGINAPVNVNVLNGQVFFGAVQCNVSGNQTADQRAACQATAIAGKAGDIVTFEKDQIPSKLGVNKFELGQVTGKKELNNIKAPTINQGVLVSFATAQGVPVNFLIRRTLFKRSELAGLDTETPEAQAYKTRLEANFAKDYGNEAALTSFYRQKRGFEQKWTELYTRLDSLQNYPFAPTFNIRVYPNGLVVVETVKGADKSKQLFPVGDFNLVPTELAIPKQDRASKIPIGMGKYATAKDV